jgi:hypothetical protein
VKQALTNGFAHCRFPAIGYNKQAGTFHLAVIGKGGSVILRTSDINERFFVEVKNSREDFFMLVK